MCYGDRFKHQECPSYWFTRMNIYIAVLEVAVFCSLVEYKLKNII